MEGNNNPLALNAWDINGPNSQMAALDTVAAVVDPEKDEFYANNLALTKFIIDALCQRITDQSQANFAQYQNIAGYLTREHTPFVQGQKEPAELIQFMMGIHELKSIEIGRRTHARTWNTQAYVDMPIREKLDYAGALATQVQKSKPLYRLKNLDARDVSDNYFVQIDRKRTVRTHFGGQVLTIVRNSLVLHNTGTVKMPPSLIDFIRDERYRSLTDAGYDYDEHAEQLRAELEEHVANRDNNNKPEWAIPIQTSYYSAMEDAVKAKNLKDFSDWSDLQ